MSSTSKSQARAGCWLPPVSRPSVTYLPCRARGALSGALWCRWLWGTHAAAAAAGLHKTRVEMRRPLQPVLRVLLLQEPSPPHPRQAQHPQLRADLKSTGQLPHSAQDHIRDKVERD